MPRSNRSNRKNAANTDTIGQLSGEGDADSESLAQRVEDHLMKKWAPQFQIENLVVVRESDQHSQLLMDSMIRNTARIHKHVPGCERLRTAGIEPLQNPKAWNGQFESKDKNRSVVFMLDGTAFFFFMGSAAKSDAAGDNMFTDRLVDLIEDLKPRNVCIATFSRLVRSAQWSGKLLNTFKRFNVQLKYANGTINPAEPMGEAQWLMLSMFASMERYEIVSRNLIGLIGASRRGECPWGERGLPVGYKLQGKRVVPDASMRDAVRSMLLILADSSLTYPEAVKAIGAFDIERVNIAWTGEDGGNVADARDPRTVIESMLKWIPLYESGTYISSRSNPLSGADEIGGIEVVRDKPGDEGVLHIP